MALLLAKLGKLPAAMIYPLSAVAGFGGGYLLNAVISRIPVYRWLVLGIREDRLRHRANPIRNSIER